MRMSYPAYNVILDFAEGQVNTFCVENPKVYTELFEGLWKQLGGESGEWVLSDHEKILAISKTMVGVCNPLMLDCNEKKIINKIYAECCEVALRECVPETAELNGRIVEYLDMILVKLPYHLKMNENMDLSSLLKIFDVKMEECDDSLLERIVDYLKAMHRICHIDFFVFVNLKLFLLEEELKKLYEFVSYEKISLFLLEGVYKKDELHEKCWIFDRDLCMIEVKS